MESPGNFFPMVFKAKLLAAPAPELVGIKLFLLFFFFFTPQEEICPRVEGEGTQSCTWASAVNVRDKYIYVTQPKQNRVMIIDIQTQKAIQVLTRGTLYSLMAKDLTWDKKSRSSPSGSADITKKLGLRCFHPWGHTVYNLTAGKISFTGCLSSSWGCICSQACS